MRMIGQWQGHAVAFTEATWFVNKMPMKKIEMINATSGRPETRDYHSYKRAVNYKNANRHYPILYGTERCCEM